MEYYRISEEDLDLDAVNRPAGRKDLRSRQFPQMCIALKTGGRLVFHEYAPIHRIPLPLEGVEKRKIQIGRLSAAEAAN